MTHKDLKLYQLSLNFVTKIYDVTEDFPKSEVYGLTSQLRRAALSIPSNIAEGSCRNSTKDFIRFLNIASGSIAEVEAQIEIAKRLRYIENIESIVSDLESMRKMLYRLKESLKKKL
jgi:four helix bundle protein